MQLDIHEATPQVLAQAKGHVVVFRYDGGSNPGDKRIVMVESVDSLHINGIDLLETLDDGDTAHRTYRLDAIRGNIVQIK